MIDAIEAYSKSREGETLEAIRGELLKTEEISEFYKTHQHTFDAASDPNSAVELSFVRALLQLRCKVDQNEITETEAENGFSKIMAEKLEKNFTDKEKII